MRGFGSSLEQISNKLLSAEAAVEVVKPGHRVFVGTASATPFTLVEALERRKPTPPDVELFYFLTTGLGPLWVEQQSAYHHRCFFVGSEVRALSLSGLRARHDLEARVEVDHPRSELRRRGADRQRFVILSRGTAQTRSVSQEQPASGRAGITSRS